MLFRVKLKAPDCLERAVESVVEQEIPADSEDDEFLPLTEEQSDARLELTSQILNVTKIWFKYEEYVTLEICTDAKPPTCRVVPVKEM